MVNRHASDTLRNLKFESHFRWFSTERLTTECIHLAKDLRIAPHHGMIDCGGVLDPPFLSLSQLQSLLHFWLIVFNSIGSEDEGAGQGLPGGKCQRNRDCLKAKVGHDFH